MKKRKLSAKKGGFAIQFKNAYFPLLHPFTFPTITEKFFSLRRETIETEGSQALRSFWQTLVRHSTSTIKWVQATFYTNKVNFRRLLLAASILLLLYIRSIVFSLALIEIPTFQNVHIPTHMHMSLNNAVFAEFSALPKTFTSSQAAQVASEAAPLSAQTPIVSPTPIQLTPTPQGFCLNVPVLLYHHVEPYDLAKKEGHAQLAVDSQYFEQQMKYLVDSGYSAVSAQDLVEALANQQSLPNKTIVVTLDDGYSDAYTYAFQIAKKYNVKINLAIPAGLIENKGYLTWNQIKEMNASGLVYMYDHTWSHFSLPTGDAGKIESEIVTAKKKLEEVLGYEQKVFFYPYGTVDGRVIEILKKNGFISAFTTVHSFQQCDSFLFTLHRNHVSNAPLSTYGL